MTYRELFESFKHQLTDKYDSREVESMFFLSLESISGLKRMDFIMQENSSLKDLEGKLFEKLIESLKTFKPLQYALGEAWFNDHQYFVNENVLIPRSETEELIKIVKTLKPEPKSIIDIGTGSGCIAIELALLYECNVSAIDISKEALKVARKNAESLNAKVNFINKDILRPDLLINKKFDVIASNPPYVMESEKTKMNDNVLKYEPSLALFVEDRDPLLFYKAIRDFALKYSAVNGLIALEINEQLGQETAELFVKQFTKVEVHKDINGKDRFVTAFYEGE